MFFTHETSRLFFLAEEQEDKLLEMIITPHGYRERVATLVEVASCEVIAGALFELKSKIIGSQIKEGYNELNF